MSHGRRTRSDRRGDVSVKGRQRVYLGMRSNHFNFVLKKAISGSFKSTFSLGPMAACAAIRSHLLSSSLY